MKAKPERFGDVVLARKDVPTSYHLAVTVDDHLQEITMVNRGDDLAPSTDVHRLLQGLLGYTPPGYDHHRLIRDTSGRRLAKRDQDITIRALRENGYTPEEVVNMTGFEGYENRRPELNSRNIRCTISFYVRMKWSRVHRKIQTYCAMHVEMRCRRDDRGRPFHTGRRRPDHPNGCICIKGSAAPEMSTPTTGFAILSEGRGPKATPTPDGNQFP